jgi:hypothetical protein
MNSGNNKNELLYFNHDSDGSSLRIRLWIYVGDFGVRSASLRAGSLFDLTAVQSIARPIDREVQPHEPGWMPAAGS